MAKHGLKKFIDESVQGVKSEIISEVTNMVESAALEGASQADLEGSILKGIKKTGKKKVSVPVEIDVQPTVKNKELGKTQLNSFKQIKKGNDIVKYYTSEEKALAAVNDAYKTYESHRKEKRADSTLKRDIGNVVRLGNAYVALGGDIDKLDKKQKKFYQDNAKSAGYSDKSYPFKVDDMKKAFGLIQQMLDNGWDFSAFKTNLVNAATDAAMEATETVNKITKKESKKASKTRKKFGISNKSKVDNQEEIDNLNNQIKEEDEKIKQLSSKKKELRSKKQNEYINEQIAKIESQIESGELNRVKSLNKKMQLYSNGSRKYGVKGHKDFGEYENKKRIQLTDDLYVDYSGGVASSFDPRYNVQRKGLNTPIIQYDPYGKFRDYNLYDGYYMTEKGLVSSNNIGFSSKKEAKEFLKNNINRRQRVKLEEMMKEAPDKIEYFKGNIKNNNVFGDEISRWFSSNIHEHRNTKSDEYQAVDMSNLKMYKPYTEKTAEQYYNFIHQLEQFCINAGSQFKGFQDNIKDITVTDLWRSARTVFDGVQIEFDDFQNFVNEMSSMVEESGLQKNGKFNNKKFKKFTEKYGTDDIKTRFLKKIGYQGVDLSGTSYAKLDNSNVIFDADKYILKSEDKKVTKEQIASVINTISGVRSKEDVDLRYVSNTKGGWFDISPEKNEKQKSNRFQNKIRKVSSDQQEAMVDYYETMEENIHTLTDQERIESKRILTRIGEAAYLYRKKGEDIPEYLEDVYQDVRSTLIGDSKRRAQDIDSKIEERRGELNSLRSTYYLSHNQQGDNFLVWNTKEEADKYKQSIQDNFGEKISQLESEISQLESEKQFLLNENYQDIVKRGYQRTDNAFYGNVQKEDGEIQKEMSAIEDEISQARARRQKNRKDLLQAEFDKLSNMVNPDGMTEDELDEFWDKSEELLSKSFLYGEESGKDSINNKINELRDYVHDNVDLIDESTKMINDMLGEIESSKEDVSKEAFDSLAKNGNKPQTPSDSLKEIKEEAEEEVKLEEEKLDEISKIEEQILAKKEVIDAFRSSLADNGGKDEDIYQAEINKFEKEIEELEKQKEALQKPEEDTSNIESNVEELKEEEKQAESTGEAVEELGNKRKEANKKGSNKAAEENADALKEEAKSANDVAEAMEKKAEASKEAAEVAATPPSAPPSQPPSDKPPKNPSNDNIDNINKATDAIKAEGDAAEEAAKKKDKFTKANQKVAESGKETADSVDKATSSIKAEGDAAKEEADIIEEATEILQHYVIGTSTNSTINPDGSITEREKTFRARDRFGTTTSYTQRPLYDEHGNATGEYAVDVRERTDYTALIRATSKAMVEQAEIQHKLDIEREKHNPDLEYMGELYTALADAIRRYNEAVAVAAHHHVEMAQFINDPNVGSKYDVMQHFVNDAINQAEAPIANINAKYRKQRVDRTANYRRKMASAEDTLNYEINHGNHTETFTNELRALLADLQAFQPIDIFSEGNIEDIDRILTNVKNYSKEGKLSANKTANENSVAKGLSQINSILSGNTKFSFRRTDVYRELRELKNEFETFDTSRPQSELNELTTRLLNVKADFEDLNDTIKGKNFFQTFVERLRGANAQLIAQYLSFQDIIRYARTMFTTIRELDTSLVDLRKTTKMNTTELNEFYRASTDVGKRLGVTSQEIIQQAADWSRLGFNTKEASTQMAELSSLFATVSPGMSTEQSTDYLVSTIQAFGIETDEVQRKILDNVNAVGNAFATTNAEIGEMLTRSSAAMKAANNTLEETIALETAAVEITRNAETTGTAFRTVSMRIRGMDEETEELSDDLKNISGDLADLTKINGQGGIQIFTDDTRTTYKSTYQILKEIAGIWDKLTDKQHAEILEKIAGKRGGQVIAGLLSDFSRVEKALETMQDADGSAERELGVVQDSIDYKLNALKQTWVGVLQDLVDRGTIGNIIDALTKISEGLGNIISQAGLLKTAFVGLSTIWGSQHLGILDTGNDNTILGAISQRRQNRLQASQYQNFLNVYSGANEQFALTDDLSLYTHYTDEVRNNLISIQQEIRDAGGSAQDMLGRVNTLMNETTNRSTALGEVFGNIGRTLLNGLASAAISTAISFAIGKISEFVDWLIITDEEAEKMANTFGDSFSSMQKTQGENIKTISSLEEEFNELSKGVNALGQNISLSDKEFERYHEITSIIADKIPSLVSGYDEQGNAIIRLTDNVKGLSDAYRDEMQSEAAAQYNMKDESGRRIVEGVYKNAREKTKDYAKRKDAYSKLTSLNYSQLEDLYNDNYVDDDYITEILDSIGFKDTKESDQAQVHAKLVAKQREFESEMKAASKQVTNAGIEFTQSLNDYWEVLSDEERTLLNSFASQMDADFLLNTHEWGNLTDLDLLDEEDMKNFMSQLIDQFQELDEEDLKQINARFNLETMFNNGEISFDEYIQKLQELSIWASSLSGDKQGIVNTLFKTADETDQADDKISRAKNKIGYTNRESRYNTAEQNERDVAINRIVSGLNGKEYELFMALDIDEKTSIENIEKSVEKMRESLKDNPLEVDVKASDSVDSMAQAKEAITSLNDLWEQTVQNNLALKKDKKYVDAEGNVTKQLDDQNMAIGYADPALINNVESAFKGFVREIESAGGDVTKLNLALEEFETTMVEQPGDANAAQKAIDQLITAYIDQTSIIQNLEEANKEWSIAQLEAMGITNAQEVVESRLNKSVKETQKNIAKLSKYLLENADALNDANKGTESYKTAISGMVEDVKAALSMYDENGNEINLGINIDDAFVEEHLADIQAMAAGDEEALNRVRRAAAEDAVLKVTAEVDDYKAWMSIQNLMDKCMELDAMNIEVGADVDDTAFIASLNNMIKSGQYTADQVAAALESMGYEAVWKPNPYTATVAEAIISKGGTGNTSADEAMKRGITYLKESKAKLDVPSLDIIRKKGSGGGGSVAHYGGGGGGKSSSGGGGGGGGGGSSSEPNKPKEEAEETFDWIEVAIQRIEEEINRLDKVVGDSYDIWIRRNKALLEEIEKTKEEIKAQQLAYSEYLRNANQVKVNNGKGLNADDYGENDELVKAADQKLLDDANKLWKTGEYQEKVRKGLLSGNDIEKIANHFLTDAIKEYQEYYNKAIAARDATQDLKIKLGELAKTKFDQVKTQAEETLQYFEAYSNLIDERINRTEEKGYFVNKKYYNDLVNYEKQSLTTLQKEYNDLINNRNEAVKSGMIANNSEAWHEMNQEILDVAQSIEEASTKLVEFANKMRQIDWDVFDYTQERISKVNDEFEFLIDLLDNQKLYDDYGIFNSRGWADTALHASKYNTYMQQALDYVKEREKIEKELAKDNADKNLIERREELIQLQQESIQNAYAEKEAVKSLVEEGINIHLSKLQELIDDYKEALSEAKNLYSYQQNITKQTKAIGDLRKQLNAYINDTSEETRALRQKLQTQLNDAEQQLKETQWDKYISETETFLSDMYDDYSETLNKRLDDIDLLMHDMIGEVNTRGIEISTVIKEVSGEVAYKMTENANTFLKNGTLVSDFKTNFDTYATTTENVLNDIKKYVASISNKTTSDAINTSSVQKSQRLTNHAIYKGVDYSSIFDLNYYMNKYPDLVQAFGNDYDKYIEHFVNHGMKEGRQASETFNVQYYRNKYSDLNSHWGNNWEEYYKHFLNHGIQEGRQGSETFSVAVYKALYKDLQDAFKNDLKKYYIHYNNHGLGEGRRAYATGSKHISSNQLAWTQDGGGELIYRSTDGAILTPLNIGDKVFTTEMSENLWNLAQLKQRPVIVPTGAGRTVNNTNAISINLPNVQNYEQFKNALQNDPNMTKFIQQVTFGEATNGIKLNRKKY